MYTTHDLHTHTHTLLRNGVDVRACIHPRLGRHRPQARRRCGAGYTLNADNHACDDVNECDSNNGGCDQTCTNSDGSYSCSCASGYTLNADSHACDDINECLTANGGCETTCTNSGGSYMCSCDSGYALNADGRACDDINECDTNNGGCDQTCTNSDGGYSCSCGAGFTLNADSHTCDDIDECLTANGGCETTCTNTDGGYSCNCGSGYALNADGHACDDINECATNNGGCGQTCTNSDGGYGCTCSAGYTLNVDNHACDDINECDTNNGGCHPNASCVNTAGSHSCGCSAGYAGDGVTACDDIDECAGGMDNCSDDATCTNSAGSFSCTCNSGFSGDGETCTNIDDCTPTSCQNSGVCVDGMNTFTCECPPFTSGERCENHECGACADVAPCQHLNDGTCLEYLTGTAICPPGSRRCVSPPAVDCGCIGGTSGPCRVSSTGVCYQETMLGDCPAGTAMCSVPTLNSLNVNTEAALLQFELTGVDVEDDVLMSLLVGSIATSAGVDKAQVVVLGLASVLDDGDDNGVAALNSGRGVVASVLVQNMGAGDSVDVATNVASQVTSLGDSIVVSGVSAEVNVVEGSSTNNVAGQETGADASSPDAGSPSFSSSPTLILAVVAAVVVVVGVVGVVMKVRSGSQNRVHRIGARVAPKPVSGVTASPPRLRSVPSKAWMDASTNVNPISQ